MDFTTFSQILQKVLIKNKSVIVPSIGCFVLEELNSEIQFDGKILTPPQKSLFFCTSETESNGELEKELSVINGYDIEQASKVLNSTVNEIRNQLDIKGEILLEGFGTISKGQGGDLYFYPHKDERFFIANLPLEPISVKPVEVKDENANDISIELDLDVDEPIANVPMQPVLIAENSCDENDEDLTLDVISGALESAEANPAEIIPAETNPAEHNCDGLCEEQAEELQEVITNEVVAKKRMSKKAIYFIILLISLLIIILLIYLFRDNLSSLLENLLYSKEELEILRKAGKL